MKSLLGSEMCFLRILEERENLGSKHVRHLQVYCKPSTLKSKDKVAWVQGKKPQWGYSEGNFSYYEVAKNSRKRQIVFRA